MGIRALWRRLMFVLRRDRMLAELEEEMRLHVELRAERFSAEGVAPVAAAGRARQRFGNTARWVERSRDEWVGIRLETWLQDVRLAARGLWRSPLFTIVALLTLAAGIGANTAMFSVVRGVLLKPLPFEAPERLVGVWETPGDPTGSHTIAHGAGSGEVRVSLPTLLAWRERQQLVELAAYSEGERIVLTTDPFVARGAAVTGNFFAFLGEPLLLGRSFAAADDRIGAPRTLILGHSLWRAQFGADASVLGRTVTLDDHPYTIIGVARPGFEFPERTQFWTALQPEFSAEFLTIPNAKILRVLGRVAAGVTLARAQDELSALAGAVPRNAGWQARIAPLRDEITNEVRPALLILLAAVMLVLLIACANVGGLLLARGSGRLDELAVRAALGAGRARIARQLLTESMLLAILAGALGVLLARVAIDVVVTVNAAELPRAAEITMDGRVLAFTLAASLLTGLLAGVAPVMRFAGRDVASLLHARRHMSAGRSQRTAQSAFVIAQVALSVVLLASAGLLIRSFAKVASVDPGFEPQHVTTFELRLPRERARWNQWRPFSDELKARVHAVAGVHAVAFTRNLPVSGHNMPMPVLLEHRERDPAAPAVQTSAVSAGYFATMRIPVVRGRDFQRDDSDRALVAVVNETFVRIFLSNVDPLGTKLKPTFGGGSAWWEIIGVVGDVRQTALTNEPEPMMYLMAEQQPAPHMTLVVRADIPVAALIPLVRTILREVAPDQPLGTIATMDDVLARSVARPRLYALVLGGFAATAVLLVILGLYGMLGQLFVQRRHELSIRLALGARPNEVLRLMLGSALRLLLSGAVLGLPAAFAAARLLESLLFSVHPSDPVTYVTITALLLCAGIVAALPPALRASRLDVIHTMRS